MCSRKSKQTKHKLWGNLQIIFFAKVFFTKKMPKNDKCLDLITRWWNIVKNKAEVSANPMTKWMWRVGLVLCSRSIRHVYRLNPFAHLSFGFGCVFLFSLHFVLVFHRRGCRSRQGWRCDKHEERRQESCCWWQCAAVLLLCLVSTPWHIVSM